MRKNYERTGKMKTAKKVFKTIGTANMVYATLNSGVFKIGRDYITNYLKDHYSRSFKVYNSVSMVNNIYDLIKKVNPKITTYYNTRGETRIINRSFFIPLDHYTVAFFNVGSTIKEFSYENSSLDAWSLELTIVGKDFQRYVDLLETMFQVEGSSISQFEVTGSTGGLGYNSTFSDNMTERKLETLFFQDDELSKITTHIDKFLKRRELYMKRGLLYKTGIILEGEPGTGKSSLVRAIASEYQFNLVTIDVTTIKTMNLINVAKSINADKTHRIYIVLLEDIDCILNLNRYASNETDVEDEDGEDKKTDKKSATQIQNDVINKLLNFLDGTDSPTNTIFIATTNFYDKLKSSKKSLDKALVRPGRIDQVFHIAGIDRQVASTMCASFGLNTEEIDDILKDETFPINQSHLQGKILNEVSKEL